MDDSTLLAAVNAQLLALTTGGVAEWQEGMHRVRHLDLFRLMELKRDLENRIAQAGSGGILTTPVIGTDDS